MIKAYLRKDGRKGIRNVTVIVYLVECAHHVAQKIAANFADDEVQVIGFPGCYPNSYAQNMLQTLCTHPNVGSVLLISLGCEGMNKRQLQKFIATTDRSVNTITIQQIGGTKSSINEGVSWIKQAKQDINIKVVDMDVSELIIGTICGGSDGTNGLTANPAIGKSFDRLVAEGAICIFEETGELIGCETDIAKRAKTKELGIELATSIEKAAKYYETLGYPSFAPGNADGGLSTIEEKSMGAYAKSGKSSISGLIKPGDIPQNGGLYLLDVVPDGEVRFGFPNIVDNADIVELIACGSHITLFATGRGSVVGSAISPVIKICANPETYHNMSDDMDINAGKILELTHTLDDVGDEIYELILAVAAGQQTKSEQLGHVEFILTYKSFEPIGPSCLA
ncbi:MAG: UxaA family hydrolase [Rhizobiales bacterium]|nr:UxaA family hydrolase [Hyphomicrobiales bacterium]